MSTGLTCNTKSSRAVKARFARYLDPKPLRLAIIISTISLSAAWAWLLLVQDNAAAHLLLIPCGIFLVLLCWYYGELNELPAVAPLQNVSDVSSVLSRRLLARVPAEPSPKDIAKIITKEQGGMFFCI